MSIGFLLALMGAGAFAGTPPVDDLPPIQVAPADWPWWRGPSQDNIVPGAQDPPIRWSKTENVVWKADVPGRGHGSPVLWGDRIFLPTADDQAKVLYLLAYDRKTGEKLWQTEIHRGGFMPKHPKNSYASATPACDGERVFLPFIAHGAIWLTALGLDGKLVWEKKLGPFTSMHGFGTSPVFYKSLVIVVSDDLKGSFIAAVHRKTGEAAWKIDRPNYKLGTYATPTVGRVAGRDQLLIQGPYKIFSYDPGTGQPLWTCDGPNESTCSTINFDGQLIWASAGFPKKKLLCVRADGSGDVTQTHIVWMKENNTAYVPSLLLVPEVPRSARPTVPPDPEQAGTAGQASRGTAEGGTSLLYMVEDEGRVTCFEATTGQVVWQDRLRGNFSSSPVLAGGRIYVVSEAGVTYVLKPGRTFELLAQNDLADGGFATPAILGGRIYLRTLHALYCLGRR